MIIHVLEIHKIIYENDGGCDAIRDGGIGRGSGDDSDDRGGGSGMGDDNDDDGHIPKMFQKELDYLNQLKFSEYSLYINGRIKTASQLQHYCR